MSDRFKDRKPPFIKDGKLTKYNWLVQNKDGLELRYQTDSYQSHIRNKLVAEAFYLTNNIEKYGSGFIRIRKELEAYPACTFSAETVGGGVLVTFSQIPAKGEGVNGLLYCIKENPGLRIPALSSRLHTPAKTVERWLKQLRDEKKIIFKGPSKTDGYYIAGSDEQIHDTK